MRSRTLIPFSRFNATLGAFRRQILNGIYDPHTNIMQYPKTMQPSHARWERIDDHDVEANESLTNGHGHVVEDNDAPTIFTPVKPIYSKNYMIVDTVYESAPTSLFGVPGPDGDFHDLGANGLSGISNEVKAELPAECLKAFDDAVENEMHWKMKWGTEGQFGHRKAPIIDKGVIM